MYSDLKAMFHHPKIAYLGFVEGLGNLGLTFEEDMKNDAYDFGRYIRRSIWRMD
jgi:hypothetical protein